MLFRTLGQVAANPQFVSLDIHYDRQALERAPKDEGGHVEGKRATHPPRSNLVVKVCINVDLEP